MTVGGLVCAGLVATVVLAALGLKLARYTASAEAAEVAARARIMRFVEGHGWRPVREPAPAGSQVYDALEFAKPGCERPLHVALLGANTELEHYLRLVHGADLSFVQDGRVSARPSVSARHWDRLSHSISWPGRGAGSLSLIAVSPAPPETVEACLPPPATAWRSIGQRAKEPR